VFKEDPSFDVASTDCGEKIRRRKTRGRTSTSSSEVTEEPEEEPEEEEVEIAEVKKDKKRRRHRCESKVKDQRSKIIARLVIFSAVLSSVCKAGFRQCGTSTGTSTSIINIVPHY
jgi:hypothetical protein